MKYRPASSRHKMLEMPQRRRTRVFLACMACRKRKIKCMTTDTEQKPCKRCVQKGLFCQYITVADQLVHSASTSSHKSERTQRSEAPHLSRPSSASSVALATRPYSAMDNRRRTHASEHEPLVPMLYSLGSPLFDIPLTDNIAPNLRLRGQQTYSPRPAQSIPLPHNTSLMLRRHTIVMPVPLIPSNMVPQDTARMTATLDCVPLSDAELRTPLRNLTFGAFNAVESNDVMENEKVHTPIFELNESNDIPLVPPA
ncbi:C6 finger domain [Mycena venus]|uniref:C6 finger domain n=1 Tax=Mycena venus TaxID=2733690 RepID=A0A8H7DB92_9AGAR|nr:C6 finger domain [Mycena venus]